MWPRFFVNRKYLQEILERGSIAERSKRKTLPGKKEQTCLIAGLHTHTLLLQGPSGNGKIRRKGALPISHFCPSYRSSTFPEGHIPTFLRLRPPPVLRQGHHVQA